MVTLRARSGRRSGSAATRCSRFLATCFATFLALLLGPAWAQPGRVLDVTPMGTLTPEQVDARVRGPFDNDGVDPPRATATVDTYLITFESRWPDGREAQAVAQLNVPRLDEDEGILLVFAPGSTGLVEACAPSRPFAEAGDLETYGRYTLAYAGQGLVSVMPNYLGFFDVGELQPYFVREAEGQVILDAARAARAALTRLEAGVGAEHVYVAGFSQGGHAAFAAADLVAEYAPDVPLRGVLGFGPSGELETLFRAFTYVAPWVLYAWQDYYGSEAVDPAEILLGGYADSLASDAERMCIAGVQGYYPSSPEAIYREEFASSLRAGTLGETHPTLAELFARNDAGLSGHGLPVMVLQGVDDPVAPIEDQHRHVLAMCEAGSPVRYPNYVRTRHETRYLGFVPAVEWMRELAAGAEPPSDCSTVPRP